MVSLTTPVAVVAGIVMAMVTAAMLYVTYLGIQQDRHSPHGDDLPEPSEAEE